MLLKKAFSLVKLIYLKMLYGKRLRFETIRQNFEPDTKIFIGKNAFLTLGRVSVKSNVHLLCDLGEMYIGKCVRFNRNCIVACREKIVIGDNCLFGPNVCIYDHDHVFTVDGVEHFEFKCSEIIIEEGCWIGTGAIILRGTHIGKNSIIEAGAVIKGIIPCNSLVTTVKETRIIPTTLFTGKRAVHSNASLKTTGISFILE